MTEREQKRLNELLAKKQAEEKHDAEFFKEVRRRRADVLKELGVSDKQEQQDKRIADVLKRLSEIARQYGITVTGLLDYISTDMQVNYYKRTHGQNQ